LGEDVRTELDRIPREKLWILDPSNGNSREETMKREVEEGRQGKVDAEKEMWTGTVPPREPMTRAFWRSIQIEAARGRVGLSSSGMVASS
jgi:hypothetical protein